MRSSKQIKQRKEPQNTHTHTHTHTQENNCACTHIASTNPYCIYLHQRDVLHQSVSLYVVALNSSLDNLPISRASVFFGTLVEGRTLSSELLPLNCSHPPSLPPPSLPPSSPSPAPSEVEVVVDAQTDRCSRGEDINFDHVGFSIFGQVQIGITLYMYTVESRYIYHRVYRLYK